MAREEDLIEEIARIRGYDSIPPVAHPGAVGHGRRSPRSGWRLRRLRRALVDRGYQEAITYSFVAAGAAATSSTPSAEPLALANPLSEDLAVMRTSLWPGLCGAAVHNRNRQIAAGAAVRDPGCASAAASGDAPGADANAWRPSPPVPSSPEQWGEPARAVDFFDVKGDLEALMALTGEPDAFAFEPAEHPALHPGRSARVLRGRAAGGLGRRHPSGPGEASGARRPHLRLRDRARRPGRGPGCPAFEPMSALSPPSAGTWRWWWPRRCPPQPRPRRHAPRAAGTWLRETVIFDVYRGTRRP
ncbi:MAG: hypothetical protein U5L11_00815 [Arhodomonas sp.]|nr:hypothetical protein [Arhodomonas sp.]